MSLEGTLKHSFTPKDLAEKKSKERKISLLLLIQHFLRSEGYIDSYNQLLNESKIPKGYEICDNMDLKNILQDYETYYYIRFEKYPKISKRVTIPDEYLEKKNVPKPKKPMLKEQKKDLPKEKTESMISNDILSVKALSPEGHHSCSLPNMSDEKLFKPFGSFEGYSDEWKAMADVISRDIVEKNLNVKWSDVVGLDAAKELLKEAIVYPMKYPQLYKEAITPWKGLLLYGPSGTGKTLLAKAVASECNTTFFNISASSVVSKWRGDSEKLIRVMFDLARLEAPSTIFVDELDAIASQRDITHEHEASRRLKSELLVQLDGLCQSNENIFFLTTSNLPWDLDVAILRRLEKKILVDLPKLCDRVKLIEMYLPCTVMTEPLLKSQVDYQLLAEKCEGYSGSDIKLLCKEVKMAAMRGIFLELEQKNLSGKTLNKVNVNLNPISDQNFEEALLKIKSSTANSIERYGLWGKRFG